MRTLTPKPFVSVIAAILATLVLTLSFVFTSVDSDTLEESNIHVVHVPEVEATPEFTVEQVEDDVLWLARAIYSETKQPHEQELVAWTIRNRVETNYRNKDTYESTVLDPWQYSAFNANSPKRHHYMNLAATSTAKGFRKALRVAHDVYHAADTERPFEQTTRHFYSERSMVDGQTPAWAVGQQPVHLADHDIDPRRFRFYASIA